MRVLLLLLAVYSAALVDGIDDVMKDLAADIGSSMTSISKKHNHKVDWMFVVDHGGLDGPRQFDQVKYFIRELVGHLYISPFYSQAGVVTYSDQANSLMPLKQKSSCGFKESLHTTMKFTPGQSDLSKGLVAAKNEFAKNGRSDVHKVTILITTASWQNVGNNPYKAITDIKSLGDLMVVITVFDRPMSIFSPVMMNFASERPIPAMTRGRRQISTSRYAFEIEASDGNLRRLYRHFMLANQKMDYLPLQVDKSFCSPYTCQAREACVCDTALFNTYHCENDTLPPLITKQCPKDAIVYTQTGQQYGDHIWEAPTATDFSAGVDNRITYSTQTVPMRSVIVLTVGQEGKGFPIGETTVVHTFKDGSGNSVSCSFKVTVRDNEPPVLQNCPAGLTIPLVTTGGPSQDYDFNVTAVDNSNENLTVTYYVGDSKKPQSLDMKTFPIGKTRVLLVFADPSGNDVQCEFFVKVEDMEPPTVADCSGPASPVYSDGLQTEVIWADPVFIDNSGRNVTLTSNGKPGYYRIGQHNVTYSAADVFGNNASCSFSFLVRGRPCSPLPPPLNGAMVCDNAIPGGVCQMFCQEPFEFEPVKGVLGVPEKYVCKGGVWFPTSQVPHCVVKQQTYKTMPDTYYFDGNCSEHNVSAMLRSNAVAHYNGFLEGRYFEEAWGRPIDISDFNDAECGGPAPITTTVPTTSTTTTLPTTSTTAIPSTLSSTASPSSTDRTTTDQTTTRGRLTTSHTLLSTTSATRPRPRPSIPSPTIPTSSIDSQGIVSIIGK